MKPILLVCLSAIIFIAQACGSIISTPTNVPAQTVMPTLATATATKEPATPTSSPTLDVNMPEGATGKDAQGYYKDGVENGRAVRFRRSVDGQGNEIVSGWFESHILVGSLSGGIPLLEITEPGYSNMMAGYQYYQQGLNGPFLRHTPIPETSNGPSYGRVFFYQLLERYYRDKYNSKVPSQAGPEFFYALTGGSFTIPFDTPQGTSTYNPKKGKYIEYVIPWDQADPAKDSRFFEWIYQSNNRYRSFTTGDANGDILIFIASEKPPETLSALEIRKMFLLQFDRVIVFQDQSPKAYNSGQGSNGKIGLVYDFAGNGVIPYIEVVHNP